MIRERKREREINLACNIGAGSLDVGPEVGIKKKNTRRGGPPKGV